MTGMPERVRAPWFIVILLAMLVAQPFSLQAAGFQRVQVPDPDGAAIEVAIWYPSHAAPAPVAMGPVTQVVAPGAAIDGDRLPLILISHGTGGSALGHHDTASALADAGYVVAALMHRGDNYADQSRAVPIMDRPKQVRRVLGFSFFAGWARGGRDSDLAVAG